MGCIHKVFRIIASITVIFLRSKALDVPPCLNQCLRSTTTPCDPSTLPAFLTCVDTLCTYPSPSQGALTANVSISLAPKTEYSCQDSLIPGSLSNDSAILTLRGDGCCVNSGVDFRSFITPGLGTWERAEKCRLTIFAARGCTGSGKEVDSLALRDEGCVFVGGRSARFECVGGRARASDAESYASLAASLCATNATVHPSTSSSSSSSRTSLSVSISGIAATFANGSVTASGYVLSSSTAAPNVGAPLLLAYPGSASAEMRVQRSVVALVGVIIFAVALL